MSLWLAACLDLGMYTMVTVAIAVVVLAAWLRASHRPGVGFVHPSAGCGGGGERVLWLMIRGLMLADLENDIKRTYVLYTKQYGSGDDYLLSLVTKQFGVKLPSKLEMVYLPDSLVSWTAASKYPRLTLLLHSVGGAVALFFGVAVRSRPTPVMIETVGFPFLYPLLAILAGVRVGTYVHYPVISSDMIRRVENRSEVFNNRDSIRRSRMLSTLKLWYYRAFAVLYWIVGQFPQVVLCNSTWTHNHIKALWRRPSSILYPPCATSELMSTLSTAEREPWVVSVGQFRPEKNHVLQLQAFADAIRRNPSAIPSNARLVLVGGARNHEDMQRVDSLRALANELGIASQVDFRVSIPYAELSSIVAKSFMGLHCMLDEHFGIVVVEYLAAGCVALANNSGGVKLDIVTGSFGRLASTKEEYADAMQELFSLRKENPVLIDEMRRQGQAHALKFSDEYFIRSLVSSLQGFV